MRAHITIEGNREGDGGGGKENRAVSRRATKGMRNGTGGTDKQDAAKQRNRMSGPIFDDKGGDDDPVEQWCRGKRGSYK